MKVKEQITLNQYFGTNSYQDELHRNADDLLLKVNSLLAELGIDNVVMTSGYRTVEHNKKIGGSPTSLHCQALAIDLADDGRLRGRVLGNLGALEKRGMAIEHPDYCVRANGNRWIHFQSKLPKSGKTVFVPYAGPPVRK